MDYPGLVLESPAFVSLSVELFSPENLAGYVSTGIITIVNLALTYLLLRWILFKPLKRFLSQRQRLVTQALDEAEDQQAKAEILNKKSEQHLQEAYQEASRLVDRSKQDIQEEKREILSQLDEELRLKRLRAEEALAVSDARYRAQRQEDVLDLSLNLIRAVYPKLSDQQTMDSIISEAEQEIKGRLSRYTQQEDRNDRTEDMNKHE